MRKILFVLFVAVATTASFAQTVQNKPSEPSKPVKLTVPAGRPWTDTGLTVQRGERLRFEATGEIHFAQRRDGGAGPEGTPGVSNEDGLFRSGPLPISVAALIGRVGDSHFAIGSGKKPVRMPRSGRLLLGVNDSKFDDNSGSFQVGIIREPETPRTTK